MSYDNIYNIRENSSEILFFACAILPNIDQFDGIRYHTLVGIIRVRAATHYTETFTRVKNIISKSNKYT